MSDRSKRQDPLSEPTVPPRAYPETGGEARYPHNACENITATERDAFLRIVEASRSIVSHHDFHLWLQGEIQRFLSHEVLISASGCFDTWCLKLDVISSVPGVRTHLLAHCGIDELLKALFRRWVDNGRQAMVLGSLEGLAADDLKCRCPLHTALPNMKSVLVHGVRDERGESDCLYVALHSKSVINGCMSGCFRETPCFVFESLIAQIDTVSRGLTPLTDGKTAPATLHDGIPFGLSAREREILEWICKGKTNSETGMILDISSFTVKNHVGRIFQKLGASNRLRAAAIYREHFEKPENGWRRS